VSAELIDRLFSEPGGIDLAELTGFDADAVGGLEVNEFAALRAAASRCSCATRTPRSCRWSVRARPGACAPAARSSSSRSTCLLDPDVRVIALDGMAGTGKTILALAAGLEQVMESSAYDKLSVYRPVVPVGKAELGFLPGGLDEKLDPWMTAVNDALVALTDTRSHADARALLDEMTSREKLSLEAVTYLRGRSLHGTYIVVDEAQNLEPPTLKTILTRVGEGTKVVFTGDTSQIDAPTCPSRTTRWRCSSTPSPASRASATCASRTASAARSPR
jgi:PhoH-like ATPase